MRNPLIAVPFVVAALVAGAAGAAIVPTSQTRTVSATAFAEDAFGSDSDTDAASAPDFGPFDDAVAATVSLGGAIGSGSGIQSSSLHPESIRAAGSHSANGEGWDTGAYGEGSGVSHCEVTFDLTEDTDYTLDGWIEAFDSGGTYILLTGPSGMVHSISAPGNDQLPIAESGHLASGSYTLTVRSSGSAFGDEFFFDYASGAYDVTFTIPIATASPAAGAADALVIAPNPFRAATTISWGRDAGAADVTVHDPAGRLVRRLSLPGSAPARWDARDAAGHRVPSGVYFVTVSTARETWRSKLTVVR